MATRAQQVRCKSKSNVVQPNIRMKKKRVVCVFEASSLSFLTTPTPVTEAYAGETILLRWDFYTNQNVKTTRWGLVENNIIKTVIADRIDEENARILPNWRDRARVSGRASLQLTTIKMSDSGVYGCEVRFDNDALLFNATALTVLERKEGRITNPVYGAIVGLVALLIVLVIIYFCLGIKRGRHVRRKPVTSEVRVPASGGTIPMDILSDPSREYHTIPILPEPDFDKWEFPRDKLVIVKVIGKGTFGQVAKGIVPIGDTDSDRIVAVKMLRTNATDENKRDLLAELELMKTLEPHPNVIQLLGCCIDTDPVLVITEYVPHGDLLGYLRKSRGLRDAYYEDTDIKPRSSLGTKLLFSFAWHVANGMDHLASRKIIHRDLAARNILVGEGEICKITDFGMARDVQHHDIYNRTSRGRLPVKWTAYESLLYGKCTSMSDVWSYGIVLYEIFTIGGNPYPKMDGPTVVTKIQEGYRMPKPHHLEEKLYDVMMKCWETRPVLRPKFSELCQTFKRMEMAHSDYVNLNKYDAQLYDNLDELRI